MNVIEPARYQPRPARRRWWLYTLGVVLAIALTGAVNYLRPLPAATVSWDLPAIPTPNKPALAWPTQGQAAIAADGYGPLDTFGNQTPLATASTAKVILALCVLQKAPMTIGQTGQIYTIGAPDVASYQTYTSQDGSSLAVTNGEQLNEYQALQALMIPSANNIADSLVRWVFGSQADYTTFASAWLQQEGLDSTHIGIDGSGYDPSTTSTATDLAQLGLIASKNPVLMQIAGQGTATFPIAGTVWNYDTVRGQSGIDGLKTGNNLADPGAFIFTALRQVGDQNIRITGSVMGAIDLNHALQESVQLAASAEQGFEQVTLAHNNQAVGSLHTAWDTSVPIVTNNAVQLVRWKGSPITEKHQIDLTLRSGNVGNLSASAGPTDAHTALKLQRRITDPSFLWRLTRH